LANNSASQQALADDPTFRRRVKDAFSLVAWEVIGEDPETPYHKEREEYARRTVLLNLDAVTTQTAPWLVNRPNLIAFETSYNFDARATVTTSGDPDIRSQLMSDWNVMAGIDESAVINNG
jgi:hypothetical protein